MCVLKIQIFKRIKQYPSHTYLEEPVSVLLGTNHCLNILIAKRRPQLSSECLHSCQLHFLTLFSYRNLMVKYACLKQI